jgi:hypothetical protein
MKTPQIYLAVIALLLYATYARHHDEYRQQQQQAEIHKLYCSENPTNPNCK